MQERDPHALASPAVPPPQVITVKTEDKPDSKKLVIPALTAKTEPDLDRRLPHGNVVLHYVCVHAV